MIHGGKERERRKVRGREGKGEGRCVQHSSFISF